MRTSFDLDDIGAVFTEQSTRFNTDRALTEVHDAQPSQWKRRNRSSRGSSLLAKRCEDLLIVLTD